MSGVRKDNISLEFELLVASRAKDMPCSSVYFSRAERDGRWVSFDWAYVHRSMESCRSYLADQGIGRGESIGILLPACVSWEIVHLSALTAGVVVVGLDPHDLGKNLQHAIASSGIAYLVCDQERFDCLREIELLGVVAILVVDLADETRPLAERTEARCLSAGVDPVRPLAAEPNRGDRLATVIFTSGSTGEQKGVGYTLNQLELAVEAIVDAFPEIDSNKRTVCWLPLSNLFQRIVNLCALKVGAQVYFVGNPRQIMQYLPEIRPHVLIGVPRFFEKVYEGIDLRLRRLPLGLRSIVFRVIACADKASILSPTCRRLSRRLFSPVRKSFGGEIAFLISGSAPMPRWLLNRFDVIGMPVLEAYGLSENIVPIAANRVTARRAGSVGLPLRFNELKVAADGELLCRGPGVCRNFLADEHRVVIDEDGFLSTGDYAQVDVDGFVWLKGRKSEVFKTSTGRRISPVEIEEVIKRSGVVEHAVVLGAGQKFLAAIVSAPEQDGSTSKAVDLVDLLRAVSEAVIALPAYKRPVGIVVVRTGFSPQTGELTANLKLRRAAIGAKYAVQVAALYDWLDSDVGPDHCVVALGGSSYLGRL